MVGTGKDLEDLKTRDAILEMYGEQNYFLSLLLFSVSLSEWHSSLKKLL